MIVANVQVNTTSFINKIGNYRIKQINVQNASHYFVTDKVNKKAIQTESLFFGT